MGLEKISDNIWLHRIMLEHYDVCAVLLHDDKQAVLWDTLTHPRHMKPFLPLIEGKALTVIYSHADWDHIWGTAGLPHEGAEIVGHTRCGLRFRSDVRRTLGEQQKQHPSSLRDVKLIAPTLVFDSSHTISLAGLTLHLHHLPGHTEDSIVAFVEEENLLLMGDSVETPFPCVPEKCPVDEWIAALQGYAADPSVHRVIPSHGPLGGKEILRANLAYLQGLLDGEKNPLCQTLNPFYRTTHEENILHLQKPG